LRDALIQRAQPEGPAVFVHSSGSTGKPKGVVLSHRNLLAGVRNAYRGGAFQFDETILAYLPIAWVGDFAVTMGAGIALRFTINIPERQETVLHNLREIAPTFYLAAPRSWDNLLTAILGSVDLGRMSIGNDPNVMARHLSTIETAAKEAAGMTSRLLAFAGTARLDRQLWLLHDVIGESIALAHDFVGTAFAVHVQSGPPLELEGDFTLVTHAIGGVLANAHEAAPHAVPMIAGGIRTLDADELATFHDARRIQPGPFVVLTITNEGDVLSPRVLERSFEPFYSTKFLGRRLGLAAANGTARGHGGAMRLEARAQGGAVTTIALPALPQALRAIG
jgi:signal transduction histidine kinase